LGSGGLSPIILVHDSSQEIPNELIHRGIPLQGELPGLKEKVFLDG
jgi:hypothetical protein